MVQVHHVELRRLEILTRIPFRYGIATLRACPHLFVRVTIEADGRRVSGVAADHLPPKWFTKTPGTPFKDDVRDMLDVIAAAGRHAARAGRCDSVYTLVSRVHLEQSAWARAKEYPPLLSNFGTSLVERALIDAFCRAKGMRFADAIRSNALGVRFGDSEDSLLSRYKKLAGTGPGDWLGAQPIRRVFARHTVGMLDPLTDAEIADAERVNDGLPQSLEAAIGTYGLSRFKIKVPDDLDGAIGRLRRFFEVASTRARQEWRFTLDFNENFREISVFRQMWEQLANESEIRANLPRLDFVEQPVQRDEALSPRVKAELGVWANRPAIIIDESDGYPGAALDALACGYAGTSHKNCKGILKGLANACEIARLRRENPARALLLSGEDLCNIGPVALNQDLAFDAAVRIENVERNGHHYVRGLSSFSTEVQEQALAAHGDLYQRHSDGFVTLNIRGGVVSVGSIVDAPFGVGFELDVGRYEPVE